MSRASNDDDKSILLTIHHTNTHAYTQTHTNATLRNADVIVLMILFETTKLHNLSTYNLPMKHDDANEGRARHVFLKAGRHVPSNMVFG